MRIDAGQHLRMDQRMKLAPRMIQSMEILQLSTQALEERIEQELVSNPTLELREPGMERSEVRESLIEQQRDAGEGERVLVVGEGAKDAGADDFERLNTLTEEYGDTWSANNYGATEGYRPPGAWNGERDRKQDAMLNSPARAAGLADLLLEQWGVVEVEPDIRRAGVYLIGFIDEDGYIRTPMEDLVSQAPPEITEEQLETALQVFQESVEPVGVGARDVRECLLLQIYTTVMQEGDTPELRTQRLLVTKHLPDIEANRLPAIVRATGLTIDEVKRAILGLRRFHIHPGRMLAEEPIRTLTPDAIVEYDEQEDRYIGYAINGRTPNLHVSTRYMKMGKDRTVDKQTRDFVSANIRSANWLIEAIEQRQNTLLRVISVVIEAQRDFLDFGPQALKPLPMTQVADQLGIHVATVSRAVNEKYIETPRGILPLRMFFSGGTETEGGDSMSWSAVQAKLEEIIAAEDKTKPLNDDELVLKLKEAGIELARRTVAKYRSQLNIGSARQRRQF